MKAMHSLGGKPLFFGKEIPQLFQLSYFGEWVWSKGKPLGPNKVLNLFTKKLLKIGCDVHGSLLFQHPPCELALTES